MILFLKCGSVYVSIPFQTHSSNEAPFLDLKDDCV